MKHKHSIKIVIEIDEKGTRSLTTGEASDIMLLLAVGKLEEIKLVLLQRVKQTYETKDS